MPPDEWDEFDEYGDEREQEWEYDYMTEYNVNSTLQRMRDVSEDIIRGHPEDDPHPYSLAEFMRKSQELALMFQGMDAHIGSGGDLPNMWNASHPPF